MIPVGVLTRFHIISDVFSISNGEDIRYSVKIAPPVTLHKRAFMVGRYKSDGTAPHCPDPGVFEGQLIHFS